MVESADLTALGWVSRAVPLLLLGGLLGNAVDRLRVSETRRHHLEEVAVRQRQAAEINDTIVQGLAAAKWSLEAGQLTRGLEVVDETLGIAHRLVNELLGDADEPRRVVRES